MKNGSAQVPSKIDAEVFYITIQKKTKLFISIEKNNKKKN